MHSCGGCPERWTGTAPAHCSGCHRTFSTVGNFDRHRANGVCLDPAERGLILNPRDHWSSPIDEEVRDRLASIRKTEKGKK